MVVMLKFSKLTYPKWRVETIEQAISQHGVPQIINSDQGSQFTSEVYIQCLEKHNIAISMDGKGRAIDNIFIERLWRSVEYEHVYLNVCDGGKQLWKGLDEYFRFYNHKRLHQSLDFRTPSEVYQDKTMRRLVFAAFPFLKTKKNKKK